MRYKVSSLECAVILLGLFLAIFNDIIRIPGTVVTGYRLLLPALLLLCLFNISQTYKFFLAGLALLIPFCLQSIIYMEVFAIEKGFDLLWAITYLIHYGSILIVFVLMHLLRVKNQKIFLQIFYKGSVAVGILLMAGYMAAYANGFGLVALTNINDYAVGLAVVFPWYLIQATYGKWKYLLLCAIILLEIWVGDSKAALMGILLEISIIGIIRISQKAKEGEKVNYYFTPAAILLMLILVLSPLRINGYSIREMFLGMFGHIMRGETYAGSDGFTSLGFRTNATIYMFRMLAQSCFLGVGPGNTGKLLKYLMSDGDYIAGTALSPHNPWLEFWNDCGLWAIVLCICIFIKAITKFFQSRHLKKTEIYFVAFTLSFPMWVISSSGIYSTYIVFIAISWLYENKRLEKKEEKNG